MPCLVEVRLAGRRRVLMKLTKIRAQIGPSPRRAARPETAAMLLKSSRRTRHRSLAFRTLETKCHLPSVLSESLYLCAKK